MEEKEEMKPEDVKSEESVEQKTIVETDSANDEKPMSRGKKIANGILLGVQILIVVLAIIITLVVILNPSTGEVSSVGVKLLPVLSDSMDGERTIDGKTYKGFKTGALVVAKTPKNGGKDLKVGDIVTFSQPDSTGDGMILNTHRIVEIVEISGVKKYKTQGDNPNAPVDSTLKLPGDIKAVYSFHIAGLGKALEWIRGGYHFIFVIIIPLGLLLIYNIYLVAQIIVENKMKKAKETAAENAKQEALASIDEEEIKRRAIEEYLRSQAKAAADASSEDKGDTE